MLRSPLYQRASTFRGTPTHFLSTPRGSDFRAVAVAETSGAEAALRVVETLEGLDDYQYFHSTRAELLRRLGRVDQARTAFLRALELAHSAPERRFIERRLDEL